MEKKPRSSKSKKTTHQPKKKTGSQEKFDRLSSQARDRFQAEIGRMFKAFRKAHSSHTQDSLANEIGVHRNAILNIEKGKTLVPLDTLYVALNAIEKQKSWRRAFGAFFEFKGVGEPTAELDDDAERTIAMLRKLLETRTPRSEFVMEYIATQCDLARGSPFPTIGRMDPDFKEGIETLPEPRKQG